MTLRRFALLALAVAPSYAAGLNPNRDVVGQVAIAPPKAPQQERPDNVNAEAATKTTTPDYFKTELGYFAGNRLLSRVSLSTSCSRAIAPGMNPYTFPNTQIPPGRKL